MKNINDSGWINLHRKILEWEWYSDVNTFRLFVHMLLKANWREGKFKGTTVPRGSFVSSIAKLAEETGLTKDEIRTAILHLVNTKEITKQSTNKYTVFTVIKYNLYQDIPKQEDKQNPSNAHSIPKLFPTIEEYKESNKEKKKENNNICPEPDKPSPDLSGIKLSLNDKSFYDVPLDKIALWKETYQAVDIEQELKKMAAWLDSNPTRRKTRRGITKFINGWLSRQQDSGRNYKASGQNQDGRQQACKGGKAAYSPEEQAMYDKYLGKGDIPGANEIWG